MNFKKKYIILFLVFICFACQENEQIVIQPQIIPTPNNLNITEGDFYLSSDTDLVYDSELETAVSYWKSLVTPVFGANTGKSNAIKFEFDQSIKNPEAYILDINSKEILIKSNSSKGAFYAVQSLIQLLPAEFLNGSLESKGIKIQSLQIEDEPRFKYRGMHLDVGRHMYPVAFIKKYIDALAILKMNTFHWHLTEDQGWRIEIKKYPKLQEIAAYRKETLIGHYSDQPHQFDGKKYGGYYTQDQVKEIVAYAQERFVTVIPEIEMPGHSQAAIAAYPELGCTGEQVEVATKWGVFEEVYCTKEQTFDFLEDVLDEVIALFPSEYIH
ncbi:MAG: beta-N-acetylhexosaminidase, partial [Winogradskyella sp.]